MTNVTLPTDSAERKEVPLFSGCFAYFPAALAGVARHSKMGNDKHNPGEPMHHARGKSMDHEDCILRHLMDLSDLRSTLERTGGHGLVGDSAQDDILAEANALAWRALALSQELHEKYGGAPLAPGAGLPEPEPEWGYNTGLQPVPDDVVVEYRLAMHDGEQPCKAPAGQLYWDRLGCDSDIVEWRLAE